MIVTIILISRARGGGGKQRDLTVCAVPRATVIYQSRRVTLHYSAVATGENSTHIKPEGCRRKRFHCYPKAQWCIHGRMGALAVLKRTIFKLYIAAHRSIKIVSISYNILYIQNFYMHLQNNYYYVFYTIIK